MNSSLNIDLKTFADKKLLYLPLIILLADIVYYVTCVFITLQLDAQFKWLMVIPTAFAVSFLFLIGHDAAHNSFTKYKKLNQVIGRIVFLPTFHSYTAWCLSHNRIHHAHTNLKHHDDVFNPLSKEEFEQLSALGKFSYKFKRTLIGHGWMYFQELWLPKMIFPSKNDHQVHRTNLLLDFLLVLGYTGLFFYFLGSLINILTIAVLPFLFWNWLMGWVTYQQHTHPKVKWYNDKKDWDYSTAQVEGTMHVIYPTLINMSFHYIMEHTAHHLRPDIPMYQLKAAQTYLESNHQNAPRVKWSLRDYFGALKKCKLYDFEKNCWTDYQGTPTSK